MIILSDVVERKNQQGESFIALIVHGGIEFVKSQAGKFYATVRKASIPSTLDLQQAKSMIGQKMPGNIIKVPCEPYSYQTPKGEEIELDFTYEYTDNANNLTETVFS